MLYHYVYLSFSLIPFLTLKSALSEINTTSPTIFLLLLSWYIFLLSFTFNLYVYMKWVSYRQHVVGLYFLTIQTCLLIVAFRPLTSKSLLM